MNYFSARSLLSLCVLTLSACTSPIYNPHVSNQVRVGYSGVPAGCHFRGNVAVTIKDINGGPKPTGLNNGLNDLKAQTLRLGGNYVWVTHESPHFYHEYLVANNTIHPELEAHSVTGRAYQCLSK